VLPFSTTESDDDCHGHPLGGERGRKGRGAVSYQ